MFLLKSEVLKLIISTLFVLVAVNCSPTEETEESESYDYLVDEIEGEGIVGGQYVDVTKFPYIAQIIEFGEQVCGAAIISEHWLLTAAHCLDNSFIDFLRIIVGTKYRNEGGNVYYAKQVIQHENFNYSSLDNDIALIELYDDIYFNRRQKPIPIGKINPKEGQSMKVAGFGRRGEGRSSTWKLKGGVIPVVNTTQCNEEYKEVTRPRVEEAITRNMFCAGKEEDDTCEGDSGGPAVINGKLVGIISWGFDCGASKLPGVYTLVNNYHEWISNHTGLTL